MDKIIILIKKIIFGLHLSFIWYLLDDLKFFIQKKILQIKAVSLPGNDQLKKELAVFFKGRKTYQFIDNPAFLDTPFMRHGETRFKIVKDNLSVFKGKLLDIGASLGYFCHKFEDEGFDCYALEANRMLCYFMEKLKKNTGKHFKIIPQSVFDYKRNDNLEFDVILALSIFHNLLATKEMYFELPQLLKRLKAKELFFETYVPNSQKPSGYYKDLTPEQFAEFIMDNSCFKKCKFIGKSEDGRPIYKFTLLP